MMVLGIETSCDETAVALLHGEGERCRILAESVASQIEAHARFGGVVPEIASREHIRLLPPMAAAVMREASADWRELDAIAVTAGPGLMGALLVGVGFARGAAAAHGLRLLPVHHMEGHLLAPGIAGALPAFPFVSLLVSGGHTLLVRVDGVGRYRVIGQTLDDAAGECFDKTARLLGLPYPGGPEIARLAVSGDPARAPLPRPMLNRDNLDFSFSGLKTAVMHALHGDKPDAQRKADVAASVELAVADVLSAKAIRACQREGARDLVAAGGVAANTRLRAMLAERAREAGIRVHLPDPRYCTDNAAMIAYAGWLRLRSGLDDAACEDWDAMPRWRLGES